MALAVTHIIVTILFLDIIRHYIIKKESFPRHLLVVGGIAGLLPDIDVPLTWVYNFMTGYTASLHGTFSHSLIFPLLLSIITIIFFYFKRNNYGAVSAVITVGLFMHILLDCAFGGYSTLLWPFHITTNFCPQWQIDHLAPAVDAFILIGWLIHEELHKKIRDYM